MPAIAKLAASVTVENGVKDSMSVKMAESGELDSTKVLTPLKRRLRSSTKSDEGSTDVSTPEKKSSPPKRKSPRRSVSSVPDSPSTIMAKEFGDKLTTALAASPLKRSAAELFPKSEWNPTDLDQVGAVKEALHVSSMPSGVVCREDELFKVLQFCKSCVEDQRSRSLYICGCPGTGKSMVIEKVKDSIVDWSLEMALPQPEVLSMNCTSLTSTSEIFVKILQKIQPRKKISSSAAALCQLQKLYSQDGQSPGSMLLLIIDELDYLITKDRAVLHELFMLTTLPLSKCVLIGIANAIDLADRFLPRLQSLNCKPMVLTFRAYSKDQILKILLERLTALPYKVFQPQALELCSRKVAAASGDMRKALSICRSAVEILEAERKEFTSEEILLSSEGESNDSQSAPTSETSKEFDIQVRVNHMAIALSKAYRSPVVETIQSLPQHQQLILCSAVKLVRGGKKEATLSELNKSYVDLCKSVLIPPVGIMEISSMCRVLNDQGLLKVGQVQKVQRVTLRVDPADITFSLQGVRLFRNCLQ